VAVDIVVDQVDPLFFEDAQRVSSFLSCSLMALSAKTTIPSRYSYRLICSDKTSLPPQEGYPVVEYQRRWRVFGLIIARIARSLDPSVVMALREGAL
jgi:hypothetical protein